MKKYVFNNKGISLVEVLIVLTIIGITGAIIVPSTGIVQRNRLKSMASQIAMDIKKVRFFAQTHDNFSNFKITFESPVEEDGTVQYYKGYHLHGKELSDTEPITEGIVQIIPMAKKVLGEGDTEDLEKLITELQFDRRGRITIQTEGDSITYDNSHDIVITFKIDKYEKEMVVRPLTAHTYIGETIVK